MFSPACILGNPKIPQLRGIAPCGVRTFLPWLMTKSDPPLIRDDATLADTVPECKLLGFHSRRFQCSQDLGNGGMPNLLGKEFVV